MALPLMLGICLVSSVALYFTSKATKATTNATSSSPLSCDPEEMESPGSGVLSHEKFDSGPPVEAAAVENSTVEKATECNIPSPVAPNVVHAAEGLEATEADATPVKVEPMAAGNTLATECIAPSTGAAVVDGDVKGNSSAGLGCNVPEVVDEVAKADVVNVEEGDGATGRRSEEQLPRLWEVAKRKFRWAKAKLKIGAEWMMLDPDVVRRILKRLFVVAVDSVVNQAFKGLFKSKYFKIVISELKCSYVNELCSLLFDFV